MFRNDKEDTLFAKKRDLHHQLTNSIPTRIKEKSLIQTLQTTRLSMGYFQLINHFRRNGKKNDRLSKISLESLVLTINHHNHLKIFSNVEYINQSMTVEESNVAKASKWLTYYRIFACFLYIIGSHVWVSQHASLKTTCVFIILDAIDSKISFGFRFVKAWWYLNSKVVTAWFIGESLRTFNVYFIMIHSTDSDYW